ncbi:MAG: polysaccharide biosynthesis/export family protein [Acidobacteria bacterium]|nr:polysaccharide biosynthesis/export family protein [Acidobacteriota bacterium]
MAKRTMTDRIKFLSSFALALMICPSNIWAQDRSATAGNNPFTPSPNTSLTATVNGPALPSTVISFTHSPQIAAIAPSKILIDPLANSYRIGVNDVLRIDKGNDSQGTTYITVAAEGNSILGGADTSVILAGKTPEQVEAELGSMFGSTAIQVSVREYASRFVVVRKEGFAPINIAMRREAVPLFIILSELENASDYSGARLLRSGSEPLTVDLSESQTLDLLLLPGDVIELWRKKERK